MSKFNLYSIYDRASETFNTPLAFVSDAVAIRCLRETLRDPSTIMARYPEDYSLVKVAEFFVENGEVVKTRVVLLDSFADLVRGVELSGGQAPQEAAARPEPMGADQDSSNPDVSSNSESTAANPKQKKETV